MDPLLSGLALVIAVKDGASPNAHPVLVYAGFNPAAEEAAYQSAIESGEFVRVVNSRPFSDRVSLSESL
jgi:hypothetical protein